jgi:hypothetical protein
VFELPEFQESDVLHMHALSRLVLVPSSELSTDEIRVSDQLLAAADAHHVLLRAGTTLKCAQRTNCAQTINQEHLDAVLANERARIRGIIRHLAVICQELEASGTRMVVIKSLDHWRDFGSDVDLYTDTPEGHVTSIMRSRLDAEIVAPTLSDRLANKVNYRVPGLQELIEIHFGRLGQTGEHVEIGRRVLSRCRVDHFDGISLRVPAQEEKLVLATLQRMYRHFYIRLCDMVNGARIVESGEVDFDELRHVSKRAGIWPGVATYLKVVSRYVEHYRGYGLPLPYRVQRAARFGWRKLYPHAGFLRFPFFPQGASLYGRQLTKALRCDPAKGLRLALLPPLAAAATAKYKVTASDKGIW